MRDKKKRRAKLNKLQAHIMGITQSTQSARFVTSLWIISQICYKRFSAQSIFLKKNNSAKYIFNKWCWSVLITNYRLTPYISQTLLSDIYRNLVKTLPVYKLNKFLQTVTSRFQYKTTSGRLQELSKHIALSKYRPHSRTLNRQLC